MKKYYEIEGKQVKEIKSKYYEIYIDGMNYGNLVRKTEDFNKARQIYKELKEEFNIFRCTVIFDKKYVFTDGTHYSKNMHKKEIGQDFDLQLKFNQVIKLMDEIDSMKKMYQSLQTEADKYVSAFTHVIEEENSEELSDEELRQIVRSVEEKVALRRISKAQTDYIHNITNNIGSVRSNANKCIETCKKLTYLSNTEKAKQNSKAKSEEYRKILNLAEAE